MSIKDLREMKCQHCRARGLRVRSRVETELVMGERVKERIYWIVLCEYCSKENKILYEES